MLLNRKHLSEKRRLRERLALAEVEQALDDFGATWEVRSGDERREMLRSVVEHLRVFPDYAELKILCLPEVRLDLRFRRGRKTLGTSPES